jgi:hypothetical protein
VRHLAYVLVELGPCQHCRMDAGEHSIDGLCYPQSCHPRSRVRSVEPTERRPCYRGEVAYAFVDLAAGESLALVRQLRAAHAA